MKSPDTKLKKQPVAVKTPTAMSDAEIKKLREQKADMSGLQDNLQKMKLLFWKRDFN